jgi:hypothetical protein
VRSWFAINYAGMILMKRWNRRAFDTEQHYGRKVVGPIEAANIQEARQKARELLGRVGGQEAKR